MTFKAKLRRIGNSQGVYIPTKVITGYEMGDFITLEVITPQGVISDRQGRVITDVPDKVITPEKSFNMEMCTKHRSNTLYERIWLEGCR